TRPRQHRHVVPGPGGRVVHPVRARRHGLDAAMGGLSQMRITVVGIGADGHLPPRAATLVARADVVLGGERHLELVIPVDGQERHTWPRPMSGLPDLLATYAGRRVVALASGDPLVSGIGTTLVRLLGADAVTVV